MNRSLQLGRPTIENPHEVIALSNSSRLPSFQRVAVAHAVNYELLVNCKRTTDFWPGVEIRILVACDHFEQRQGLI